MTGIILNASTTFLCVCVCVCVLIKSSNDLSGKYHHFHFTNKETGVPASKIRVKMQQCQDSVRGLLIPELILLNIKLLSLLPSPFPTTYHLRDRKWSFGEVVKQDKNARELRSE